MSRATTERDSGRLDGDLEATFGIESIEPGLPRPDGEAELGLVAPEAARRRTLKEAVFNGAVQPRHMAFIECADEAGIRAALRVASDHALPVSVLGGGHDMCGRALAAGNLVLDLSRMRQVRVDAANGAVTVEGAALTRDLVAALPDDLVTPTGTVSSVGMIGLALGGGYGRLTSRFGLASDCMTSARVVLADGSVVTASEHEDADLLWALRGGGGSFGVVSSMTLALHRLPRVLSATILYPLDTAREILLRVQDQLDRNPVDLSHFVGFMTAPTGEPVLFVMPLWSGAQSPGEALVQELATAEGALVLQNRWCTYRDTFDEETEKAWPKGRHYHLPTRTLRRIDGTAAEILVESARRMTSPFSAIVVHDFHGRPTQMAPEATAFPLREDHFVVEVIAAWDAKPGEDGVRHRAWAEAVSSNLSAIAMPGGYVNLLSPLEGDRVELFYGRSADRLREIKRRVDPTDLFRSGCGRL